MQFVFTTFFLGTVDLSTYFIMHNGLDVPGPNLRTRGEGVVSSRLDIAGVASHK